MRAWFLSVLVLISLTASAFAEEWDSFKEFVYKPGKVALKLPGRPEVEKKTVDTATGKRTITIVSSKGPGMNEQFLLMYFDGTVKGDRADVFDDMEKSFVSAGSTVQSRKDTKMLGYPTRALRVAAGPQIAELRIIIAPRRTYVILGAVDARGAHLFPFTAYFNSLRLTK